MFIIIVLVVVNPSCTVELPGELKKKEREKKTKEKDKESQKQCLGPIPEELKTYFLGGTYSLGSRVLWNHLGDPNAQKIGQGA